MRRLLFFILIMVGLIGSVFVVLFLPDFIAASIPATAFGGRGDTTFLGIAVQERTGFGMMAHLIAQIRAGTFSFGGDAVSLFTYSVAIYLVIVAAIILTMLLLLLFTLGSLRRISRFYSISTWFSLVAFLMTGAYIWAVVHLTRGNDTINFFQDFPIWGYVPIAVATILPIIGWILSVGDNRND